MNDSIAAENSSTAAIANSVWRIGGEVSSSAYLRIVAASGRDGSTKKIAPSAGLGEKPIEPETIASITTPPRPRATARTVPATRTGRAVRTAIFQNVRQLLIPS